MSSADIPGVVDYSDYWRDQATQGKHLRFNATTQDGKEYAFDVPPWALVTQFFGEDKERMVGGRRPVLVFGDAAWWNHVKDLYSPLLMTYPDLNREINLGAMTAAGQPISSNAWAAIAELVARKRVSLQDAFSRAAEAGQQLLLNVILKADVQGSLEAVTDALEKLNA